MPELSIIVPCHNDAGPLPATLAALHQVVAHHAMNVETLVIDSASSDGTLDAARGLIDSYPALHLRVFARNGGGGFGSMVRYGAAYAEGRYAALVSADGFDPVELLPQFLARLREGAHLVQCSRYLRPEDAASVSRRFRAFQAVYRACARALLGVWIHDTTNGFRAFDRRYVLALGLTANRFNVCPEVTFKVLLSDGAIAYVPGRENTSEHPGTSKFKARLEMPGYAAVLARAALHRWGWNWY